MYTYAGLNPIRLIDQNGEDQFVYFWSSEQSETGVGHVAWGVGTQAKQEFYEANPTNGAFSAMKTPFKSEGAMQNVLASSDKGQHGKEPDLILRLSTLPEQDKNAKANVEQFFKGNKNWTPLADCADVAKTGMKATTYDPGKALYSTPQELAQDIQENNQPAISAGLITTLKGDLKGFGAGTGATRGFIQNSVEGAGQWLGGKAYELSHPDK